jgi:hypothetical protein
MKKWIIIGILAILVIGLVIISGCITPQSYQVQVIYPGSWTATYFIDNTAAIPVTGTGTMTYDVQTPSMMVGIFASKRDDSSQRLTVQVLRNGQIIKSGFTDAPGGSISVVESTFGI